MEALHDEDLVKGTLFTTPYLAGLTGERRTREIRHFNLRHHHNVIRAAGRPT
jgi:hypothetical protein